MIFPLRLLGTSAKIRWGSILEVAEPTEGVTTPDKSVTGPANPLSEDQIFDNMLMTDNGKRFLDLAQGVSVK